MKKTAIFLLTIPLFFAWLLIPVTGCSGRDPLKELRDGDILFQVTGSVLSLAIREAMDSPYCHCGIACRLDGRWYVYEAIQPVSLTPLQEWIDRGMGRHYVVKRLRNADEVLTSVVLQKMQQEGGAFYRKDYDTYFNWSDERIYCSELVWKIYHRATGIELGEFKKLHEFDLSAPFVQDKMEEIFGGNPTLDEPIISPAAIFECDLLEEVGRRGTLTTSK